MNYFRVLSFLERGDKTVFDVSLEDQKHYMESLGEAVDDIDRGFKQYLCQNFFVSRYKIFLFNIIALVLLPFVIFFYLVKGLFVGHKEHVDAILESKGMDEVVPSVLWEEYQPDSRFWCDGSSMKCADIPFLLKLVNRAPFHPYFVLKSWMNVVRYSNMIYKYSPNTLIQFGEFSFSSSILTSYCHLHGITHIDVMHGEKLFIIRDAFFHYDRCYVWDEHYVNLFCSLKAEPSQFVIAIPESIRINTKHYYQQDYYADYKYYLATITESELISIVKSLQIFKTMGKTIKYRPHPRYTDISLLKKYIREEEIENPGNVNILYSISNLTCAIGSYSTVLGQAYFSGKDVLLDDVTYKDQFNKLKDLKYILAEKGLNKLSSILL